MKRKPILIDWDELETAFENRNEDLTYYLDLVTGQVILEGEGEDLRFDDDALDNGVEVEVPDRREPTRLYVESFTPDDELDWMDEFIEGDEGISAELKDKLGDLVAQAQGEAFKDELRQNAELRDRWFLFRSERLHEVVDAWLDANNVNPSTRPPWRP
jgi:Uncharacterised protein family (UPF0158)